MIMINYYYCHHYYYNDGSHVTLNLLHVSSCKMLTFCGVLHEAKEHIKQTLERAVQTGNHL